MALDAGTGEVRWETKSQEALLGHVVFGTRFSPDGRATDSARTATSPRTMQDREASGSSTGVGTGRSGWRRQLGRSAGSGSAPLRRGSGGITIRPNVIYWGVAVDAQHARPGTPATSTRYREPRQRSLQQFNRRHQCGDRQDELVKASICPETTGIRTTRTSASSCARRSVDPRFVKWMNGRSPRPGA